MISSRRQKAKEDLGLDRSAEEAEIEKAVARESIRRDVKEAKRQRLLADPMYSAMRKISTVLDEYYVDAIIGFVLPGIGDIVTAVCTMPFIWYSLMKIRSVPLTLAVIYNTLVDVMLGLIPFFVGDILDLFHRAYSKNMRLISGFVDGDKEVIREVNRKAWRTGVLIGLWVLLIVVQIWLLCKFVSVVFG